MTRDTETRCVCDARIRWVPSVTALLGATGAWVHTDGPQRGAIECYAFSRDIVAEPSDLDDILS